MNSYETTIFERVLDHGRIPMPQLNVLDCRCHHCGKTTRVPVPTEFIDYERISEDYRRAYAGMSQYFVDLFAEAGRVFDAPLKEWLEAKEEHMKLRLEELLNQKRP